MDSATPRSSAVVPRILPNPADRRLSRRVKLAQPVRVRPADHRYAEEVRVTVNLSRGGLFFTTSLQHYRVGTRVDLDFECNDQEPFVRSVPGEVVRLERRPGGHWGVAVRLLLN